MSTAVAPEPTPDDPPVEGTRSPIEGTNPPVEGTTFSGTAENGTTFSGTNPPVAGTTFSGTAETGTTNTFSGTAEIAPAPGSPSSHAPHVFPTNINTNAYAGTNAPPRTPQPNRPHRRFSTRDSVPDKEFLEVYMASQMDRELAHQLTSKEANFQTFRDKLLFLWAVSNVMLMVGAVSNDGSRQMLIRFPRFVRRAGVISEIGRCKCSSADFR